MKVKELDNKKSEDEKNMEIINKNVKTALEIIMRSKEKKKREKNNNANYNKAGI